MLERNEIGAGHSLGEYSALVASGALSFAEAGKAVRLRGRFMQEAVPVVVGAMAAVLGMARPGHRAGNIEDLQTLKRI